MTRKEKNLRKKWNKTLQESGLSMDAGLTPLVRYAGSINDLADLEAAQFATSAGCGGGRRVRPMGAKPE